MNWYKITLDDEQIMHGAPIHLLLKIQSVYESNQAPTDFCVFKEMTAEDEKSIYFVYFSPVASEYCCEIIAAYGGKKCNKPSLTEDLSGWVGERKCSWYLTSA
jgi:hypothetical protein